MDQWVQNFQKIKDSPERRKLLLLVKARVRVQLELQ